MVFEVFVNDHCDGASRPLAFADDHTDAVIQTGDDLELGVFDLNQFESIVFLSGSCFDGKICGSFDVFIQDRSVAVAARHLSRNAVRDSVNTQHKSYCKRII